MKNNTLSKHTSQIRKTAIKSVAGLLMCALSSTAVQAAWREKSIAVTVQGDGTVASHPAGVSCPGDCAQSYSRRERYVTLTASARADSRFLGWEGACVRTEPTCRVKMRGSSDVTALFGKSPGKKASLNSGHGVAETGAALQEASAADSHATLPDGGTGENIQMGWSVFSVQ